MMPFFKSKSGNGGPIQDAALFVIRVTGTEMDGDVQSFLETTEQRDKEVLDAAIASLRDTALAEPLMTLSSIVNFIQKKSLVTTRDAAQQKYWTIQSGALHQLIADILEDGFHKLSQITDADFPPELADFLVGYLAEKETNKSIQASAQKSLQMLSKISVPAVANALHANFPSTAAPSEKFMRTMEALCSQHGAVIAVALLPFFKSIALGLSQFKSEAVRLIALDTMVSMCESFLSCRAMFPAAVATTTTDVSTNDSTKDDDDKLSKYTELEISVDQWNGCQQSAQLIFDVVLGHWFPSLKTAEARERSLDVMGLLALLMSKDHLDHSIARLLQVLLALCKSFEIQRISVTRCISNTLEAGASACGRMIVDLVDPLMQALLPQVCMPPDMNDSAVVRNFNEVHRCFEILASVFSDQVLRFLAHKLEPSQNAYGSLRRVGTLSLVKHLINRMDDVDIAPRKDQLIAAAHSVTHDTDPLVRRGLCQLVIAMANKGEGYLTHPAHGPALILHVVAIGCRPGGIKPGGRLLLESVSSDAALRTLSAQAIAAICNNPCLDAVVWPLLFSPFLSDDCAPVLSPLCKGLTLVGGRIAAREDRQKLWPFCLTASAYDPSPVRPIPVLARLLVFIGKPHRSSGLGRRLLELYSVLGCLCHPLLQDVLPLKCAEMITFLRESKTEHWDDMAWLQQVADLLSLTTETVGYRSWFCNEMASSFAAHLSVSTESSSPPSSPPSTASSKQPVATVPSSTGSAAAAATTTTTTASTNTSASTTTAAPTNPPPPATATTTTTTTTTSATATATATPQKSEQHPPSTSSVNIVKSHGMYETDEDLRCVCYVLTGLSARCTLLEEAKSTALKVMFQSLMRHCEKEDGRWCCSWGVGLCAIDCIDLVSDSLHSLTVEPRAPEPSSSSILEIFLRKPKQGSHTSIASRVLRATLILSHGHIILCNPGSVVNVMSSVQGLLSLVSGDTLEEMEITCGVMALNMVARALQREDPKDETIAAKICRDQMVEWTLKFVQEYVMTKFTVAMTPSPRKEKAATSSSSAAAAASSSGSSGKDHQSPNPNTGHNVVFTPATALFLKKYCVEVLQSASILVAMNPVASEPVVHTLHDLCSQIYSNCVSATLDTDEPSKLCINAVLDAADLTFSQLLRIGNNGSTLCSILLSLKPHICSSSVSKRCRSAKSMMLLCEESIELKTSGSWETIPSAVSAAATAPPTTTTSATTTTSSSSTTTTSSSSSSLPSSTAQELFGYASLLLMRLADPQPTVRSSAASCVVCLLTLHQDTLLMPAASESSGYPELIPNIRKMWEPLVPASSLGEDDQLQIISSIAVEIVKVASPVNCVKFLEQVFNSSLDAFEAVQLASATVADKILCLSRLDIDFWVSCLVTWGLRAVRYSKEKCRSILLDGMLQLARDYTSTVLPLLLEVNLTKEVRLYLFKIAKDEALCDRMMDYWLETSLCLSAEEQPDNVHDSNYGVCDAACMALGAMRELFEDNQVNTFVSNHFARVLSSLLMAMSCCFFSESKHRVRVCRETLDKFLRCSGETGSLMSLVTSGDWDRLLLTQTFVEAAVSLIRFISASKPQHVQAIFESFFPFANHMASPHSLLVSSVCSELVSQNKYLEAQLMCSLCGQHSKSSPPRVLPCLHSMCERCMLPKLHLDSSRDVTTIQCPFCNSRFDLGPDGVKGFPADVWVVRLLELLAIREPQSRCSLCQEIAKWEIVDSKRLLCGDHGRQHRQANPNQQLVPIEGLSLRGHDQVSVVGEQLCSEHGLPLTSYCQQCSVMVCRDEGCAGNHVEHSKMSVEDAGYTIQQQLSLKLANSKQRLVQLSEDVGGVQRMAVNVDAMADQVAQDIHAYFDKVRALLEERENELIAMTNATRIKKLKRLDEQRAALQENLVAGQRSCEFATRVLGVGSGIEVLRMETMLSNRLGQLNALDWGPGPCTTHHVSLATDEALLQHIKATGQVVEHAHPMAWDDPSIAPKQIIKK